MSFQDTTRELSCPGCGGALGAIFYETGPVPVHSCLMLEDVAEAMRFPTGTVRLAQCQLCGLVTNTDFDPIWSAYSPDYEDQQSFSPTFNSFAGELAQGLVERHGLHGKKVVEIGCSKGDFMALLCEAGAVDATGIDPSVLPGRVPAPARGRMRMIPEYYSEEHLHLPADLICHRHTLEHVQDVAGHLALLHAHAQRNPDCVVFIEVPCGQRVFEAAAFEDIYYEHASYFTPGSLARALRRAGFGVTRLWRDYGEQYLLAEARPNGAEDRSFAIETDPASERILTARFREDVGRTIAGWRDVLEAEASRGRRIAVWGSGSKCVAFLHAIGRPGAIEAIVDINPHRAGRHAPRLPLPVSPPETLLRLPPDMIVVMNAAYLGEIRHQCAELGLYPDFECLGRALTDMPIRT